MFNTTRILISFLLLYFLLSCFGVMGQGWRTSIPGLFSQGNGIMIRPSFDGGYIGLANTGENTLVKLDQYGDVEWLHHYPIFNLGIGRDVVQTRDSGFAVTGHNPSTLFLMRTDPVGDTLFYRMYDSLGSFYGNALRETPDDGFAMTGWLVSAPFGLPLVKVDSIGDTLWTKHFSKGNISEGMVLENTFDGGLIVAGRVDAPARQPFVIKTNAMGDSLWSYQMILPSNESGQFSDVEQLPDSGYILSGHINDQGSATNANDVLLVRLTAQGDTVWTRRIDHAEYEMGIGVAAAPDGGFGVLQYIAVTNDIRLMKFDSIGQHLWTRIYPHGEVNYRAQAALQLSHDGGFVFAATDFLLGSNDENALFIKTDANGHLYPNLLTGYLYADPDQNCVHDSSELDLSGWIMRAENLTNGTHFYGVSDSDGRYEISVDTGQFIWSPDTSSLYAQLWTPSPCSSNGSHFFQGLQDTAIHDFPRVPVADCPLLQVDIGTFRLRRCQPNAYTMSFQNLGTQTAYNASIDVEFDPGFVIDSASIPWDSQSSGRQATFLFDSLEVYESGTIDLFVRLDTNCNATIIGETKCVTASIAPDSLCFPIDPNWDGSSVVVQADCIGDTITRLAVYNQGAANMSAAGHVIIIEDNILRLDTNVFISAGDSIVWFEPANGSTWFIQADQSPGHPGFSFPMAFTEGCGTNSQNSFSTGFALSYPQDDVNPFISIHCAEVNGPYDPNEKVVSPAGWGPEHIVTPNRQLSYVLHFQNTGTDTAFKVVVEDQLPTELNPGTLISGASSHPYSFELLGSGLARWTFEDIHLPDSNVNEPGSHGWVQFVIDQQADLPLETRINNAVDIFFDFNEAITTDTSWVTLGETGSVFVQLDQPKPESEVRLRVYPNPFTDRATIDLGAAYPMVQLEIYDLQGRQLHLQTTNHTDTLRFSASHLSPGTYVFRVSSKGLPLGSGRMAVSR